MKMETVVLKGKSKDNLNLLVELANKLGIEASFLSKESSEDIALIHAIREGRTGQNVDTSKFLEELGK